MVSLKSTKLNELTRNFNNKTPDILPDILPASYIVFIKWYDDYNMICWSYSLTSILFKHSSLNHAFAIYSVCVGIVTQQDRSIHHTIVIIKLCPFSRLQWMNSWRQCSGLHLTELQPFRLFRVLCVILFWTLCNEWLRCKDRIY